MFFYIAVFIAVFIISLAWQIIKEDKAPDEYQYFGVKDKGYHVSVWPKDKVVGDCIEFYIAGVNHRTNISQYEGEFEGRLVAEPSNPYDKNAIKILASDGHHVGYVPKDRTDEVRKVTKLPCKCYCFIMKNRHDDTPLYYTDCYVNIEY